MRRDHILLTYSSYDGQEGTHLILKTILGGRSTIYNLHGGHHHCHLYLYLYSVQERLRGSCRTPSRWVPSSDTGLVVWRESRLGTRLLSCLSQSWQRLFNDYLFNLHMIWMESDAFVMILAEFLMERSEHSITNCYSGYTIWHSFYLTVSYEEGSFIEFNFT